MTAVDAQRIDVSRRTAKMPRGASVGDDHGARRVHLIARRIARLCEVECDAFGVDDHVTNDETRLVSVAFHPTEFVGPPTALATPPTALGRGTIDARASATTVVTLLSHAVRGAFA